MNIKEKIEEIVKKLMNDESLMKEFNTNPAKVIEKLVGVDLPDAEVNQIVTGVKAKVTADNVSNVIGSLGNMFGK